MARTRLTAAVLATALYLIAGLGVLAAPILGIGIAAAPWGAALGALAAPYAVVPRQGRLDLIVLGVAVGCVASGLGAVTFVLISLVAAPATSTSSVGGILLFTVISGVSLGLFYLPVSAPLGVVWALSLRRWRGT